MRRMFVGLGVCLILLALGGPAVATAHAPSGAIFTTLADGSEVNLNQFETREAVYLDGGPGPGAPQTAAGLDNGTYVFQVTNPSGSKLLSEDAAKCRQFVVSNGVITSVVVSGCQHVTGNDIDHPPAKTVQLFPFSLTPNPGGVYKVWATRVEDFLLGCQQLGHGGTTGLDIVDCGNAPGNRHGFIPSHSKTDNFKVKKAREGVELDVCFFNDDDDDGHFSGGNERCLPHLEARWTDTNQVQNKRFSNPNYFYGTFAHVEAAEVGTHSITILGGQGCTIGMVHQGATDIGIPGVNLPSPAVVPITVSSRDDAQTTYFVYVACDPDGVGQ